MSDTLPEQDQMLADLARMEVALAVPEFVAGLHRDVPFFAKSARQAENRAVTLEARLVTIRAHSERAGGRTDPRVMQTAKAIGDARRERDGWITRALALLPSPEPVLPAPALPVLALPAPALPARAARRRG